MTSTGINIQAIKQGMQSIGTIDATKDKQIDTQKTLNENSTLTDNTPAKIAADTFVQQGTDYMLGDAGKTAVMPDYKNNYSKIQATGSTLDQNYDTTRKQARKANAINAANAFELPDTVSVTANLGSHGSNVGPSFSPKAYNYQLQTPEQQALKNAQEMERYRSQQRTDMQGQLDKLDADYADLLRRAGIAGQANYIKTTQDKHIALQYGLDAANIVAYVRDINEDYANTFVNILNTTTSNRLNTEQSRSILRDVNMQLQNGEISPAEAADRLMALSGQQSQKTANAAAGYAMDNRVAY